MAPLHFRHLDLNLLRVFDAVMSEGSLTRAADKLALTQPAVSNALRRLREALGDELLVRQGQGMTPTPRAQTLWPAVREALTQLQTVLAPGEFDPATATNLFTLAMADATAGTLIPPMVPLLEREAPGVSLRVLPLSTRDPRALLNAEEADLAVGYFPAPLAELHAERQAGRIGTFDSHRLYDGNYVCVMRHGHPLSTPGALTLDSFCAARHLLVSFTGRPYGFVDEALTALGRQRRIVLIVNQFFTAGRVVADTDMLTVLPRHFVPFTGLPLAERPLPLPMPMVHVDALWRRRSAQPAACRWLLDTLTRAAQQAFGIPPLPLPPQNLSQIDR